MSEEVNAEDEEWECPSCLSIVEEDHCPDCLNIGTNPSYVGPKTKILRAEQDLWKECDECMNEGGISEWGEFIPCNYCSGRGVIK